MTTDDRADNPQGRHWRERTHCKNGHPFDEANTKWIVDKKGRRIRICRACLRYRGRGFREKLYGLSLDGYKRLLEEPRPAPSGDSCARPATVAWEASAMTRAA